MTVFATYGVFTCIMANPVRMTLINKEVNPSAKAFFVMLAAHDGLETGEDGPTHHGLFWMSLYTAYPGIKVYKPLDANEAVEMLFLAAQRGERLWFAEEAGDVNEEVLAKRLGLGGVPLDVRRIGHSNRRPA